MRIRPIAAITLCLLALGVAGAAPAPSPPASGQAQAHAPDRQKPGSGTPSSGSSFRGAILHDLSAARNGSCQLLQIPVY